MAETNNSPSNPEPVPQIMDRQLMKACCQNDLNLLRELILHDGNILFSVTPHRNNCLHLAAMLGHDKFAREVWSKSPSLFLCTNIDGETPLIAAVMAANAKLASNMLTAASELLQHDIEGRMPLKEMLLKYDVRGHNALNHAIRNGFEDFALKLLDIEPHLSDCWFVLGMSENLEKELSTHREPQSSSPLLPEESLPPAQQKFTRMMMTTMPPQPLPEQSQPPGQQKFTRMMMTTMPLPSPPSSEDEEMETSRGTEPQLPPQTQMPTETRPQEMPPEMRPQEMPTQKPTLMPTATRPQQPLPQELFDGLWISESAMFMAARKGYSRLVEKLLEIPSSVAYGPGFYSALDAAADNPGIYEMLLKKRPELAQYTGGGLTTLTACISEFETAKILLEDNPFLHAYSKNRGETYGGLTPFLVAAQLGLVSVAKKIITVCPDSAYITKDKSMENALHIAVRYEQESFVDFILETPQLHRLINQVDYKGQLPLHVAAKMCNPQILRSLLDNGQDCTAINAKCRSAVDIVCERESLWKTLKWNESFTLVSNAIPHGWRNKIKYVTKGKIKQQAIKEVKSLTERNTNSTSVIATLLATITFAAAFTMPGGLSSDPSDTGLPVFARKPVFQVFLISDTIAMCSSLAVAFLTVLATWEDLDYLLNYRKTTRPLMWCAYVATAVAFGTGVFTIMAPKRLWLAILVLVMCCILPFLSKIIGDWPKIRLRFKFGRQFRSDLLPNL
ncbi:hypothetical protein LUZ63_011505 [Rhynchospora breviuscula]|uniref:PGG domain-containing protein n=1 Tax=Rhynchospora breviuscula TaxID=2022672 RepID=A0A9Q0CJI7_9POAL|nr:hypothetical protein LUZ63_011505 [Rhynchospora breviuscula]